MRILKFSVDILGLAFEISAGQVVKQHIQLGSKKILPPTLQVSEEGVAMFEQAVQDVLASPGKTFAQQVAHGATLIPKPVTAPFTSRLYETIGYRHGQKFDPIGSFAAGGQMSASERIEFQLSPQFAGQPAGSILTGTAQTVVCDAHRERSGGQIGRDGTVLGKEAQVLQLAGGVIKHSDSLGPGSALGVAELAQIKKSFLERTAMVGQADVFNDAIVAMLFAVFLASDEAQKHNLARVCQSYREQAQGDGASL